MEFHLFRRGQRPAASFDFDDKPQISPSSGGMSWVKIDAIPSSTGLHSSAYLWANEPLKPSSKVEKTVQSLKEDLKKGSGAVTPAPTSQIVVKKSVWEKVKDECRHYYHGFRLLFIDINVSRKLVTRVLYGKTLSRREHRQLVRTVSDLFRLVPFSVFIIVPFMELLLPLAVKLFPGMLPSTFQTATDREDKMKQALKVKLEMAKFLQKTLDNMSVQSKGHHSESAKEFAEFFEKVRTSGETASTEDILRFSKLFEDEITLDSLSRAQLSALCRVLEIQPLGTNNFLRFQLRMKLRNLAADDKMIMKEGADTLSASELQQACRARGMRAYGMTESRLRAQLVQWLDLSLNEKVPPSLLLLSRALLLPETIPASDQLKATISVLSETAATQARAALGEREGKVDNKTKIELIRAEEKKIQEERQERRQEQELERKAQVDVLVDTAPTLKDTATVLEASMVQAKAAEQLAADTVKHKELSTKDFEDLEDALDTVAKDKRKLMVEKEELEDLKEEMADYQEDLDDLKQVVRAAKAEDPQAKVASEVKESKAAKLLSRRVNRMITNLDAVLSELEKEKQQLLDQEATTKASEAEHLVSIAELMDAIRQIQKVPDGPRLQRIAEVLSKIDDDRDGAIRVDDVLKVIELIGKDNVKLSSKQVDEILDLLDKEETLELEAQIDRKLESKLEAALAAKDSSPPSSPKKPSPSPSISSSSPPPPLVNSSSIRSEAMVSVKPPQEGGVVGGGVGGAVQDPKQPKDSSKKL